MDCQKILWIFDLDDTLFWNERCFSRAFIAFYKYLESEVIRHRALPFAGRIARQVETISQAMLEEVNPQTGEIYGVTIERFPTALTRCYEQLCHQFRMQYDESVARCVYNIGMRAFEPRYYRRLGLAPGAEATLNALQEYGDALTLLTRGDPRCQAEKILALQLNRWFGRNAIYIKMKKTPDVFNEISAQFSTHIVVSVGNAYKWDVVPALEANCFGIYIPGETWAGEEYDGPLAQTEKLFVVDEISDVVGTREIILARANN
ncbi:MAG: HAD family hydrolase [Candidatus Spechtbacteria bacterium]|nr:HAD family hydrolase [Candidatus Spechtbacteria bacterium]